MPYQWYVDNSIADHEGRYLAVFYSHFVGAGLDVVAEESIRRCRSGFVVRHPAAVWILELKRKPSEEGGAGALAQIEEKGYAEKYGHLGVPIHRVGVAFSEQDRNISAFEVEAA